MIDTVLRILGAGLSLWEHKEKTKYAEKYYKLKKKYYEESSKQKPDHAVLDDLEFELQLLGESFSSQIEGSAAKDLHK